jgi:hypothetical protein
VQAPQSKQCLLERRPTFLSLLLYTLFLFFVNLPALLERAEAVGDV